jgi:UDP-N-acetylmuramoyl-L-alanyl-D-glutamate--2,6-diaminopimelate ligase
MASLKQIVRSIGLDSPDIDVSYLSCNTADVRKDTLFIAFKGLHFDARSVITDVVKNGAVAVIYDDCDDGFIPPNCGVPCLPCHNLVLCQSKIASIFYDKPSSKLKLIGVTGTNGKSTVTHLVAQWSSLLGVKTGVMGTIGTGFYPNLKPSANTTMQALDLEKELSSLQSDGASAIAMEVSSHGLALKRVEELQFSIAAFTNLSRDHLDFHKTMENYANTKFELFKMVESQNTVINVDDPIGIEFYNKLPNALRFSCHHIDGDSVLYAKSIDYVPHGIIVNVAGSYGTAELSVPLIGGFNVQNLLCATGIMLLMGFKLFDLALTAPKLNAVCGRMECFKSKNSPLLIVDYAHTPDGLEKALMAIKEHNFGHVTCICGCGGDRDTGKRPIMAKIACDMADKVIFTNDNPRTEDPSKIIEMMLHGVSDCKNYSVIFDRTEAITKAFKDSKNGDVILIAGKGHEDYQIIGLKKHHYSDRELAQKLVEKIDDNN